MKIIYLLVLVFISQQLWAQISIEDARRESIGSSVTVTGIVLNGEELGKIRYIQDQTGGIAIYDDKTTSAERGDSITLTGELDDYNNLLEIKNVSNFTTHTSDLDLPDPKIITIDNIGEDYEGQLVQINNIELIDASGVFASNTNYSFSDGNYTGELRINTDCPLVGQAIPTGEINLIAICSQYSWEDNDTRSGYQLLPRDANDLISGSSINITSPVEVLDITKNSISLTWSTDAGGFPFIRYGNSKEPSSLTNIKAGDSTTSESENIHSAEITDLQAAQIIYAQAFTTNETDTVFSSIGAYVSQSNSSGEIKVFFNSEIDENEATTTVAKYIGNDMADTLAACINKARESIDFCIYNIDNSTISDALNAAYNQGIKIRFITCESTSHASVSDLNSNIPVIERPETQEGGIMHNKFMIIDANSNDPNDSWVWSGSTNLTSGQLFSDANNMIFIQDQSLAKVYEIEFEEMWGSTGDQPNESKALFGADKTDNTPHEIMIGNTRLESYFSPSDNTNQKLINAINTADNDLNVETMLITRSDLAGSIKDAYEQGVKVHVITNSESDNTETVNNILNESLPAGKYVFDDNAGGTLHHKMALIDAHNTNSDPQVITGSHNWSNSANDRNDENTLIVHNADITNQYFQQFAYRFKQNNGDLVVAATLIQIADVKIYPNPTEGQIVVSSGEELKRINLYNLAGEKIKTWQPQSALATIYLSQQIPGIYFLKVESNSGDTNTYKVVKK